MYFKMLKPGEHPLKDDMPIPGINPWLWIGWLLAIGSMAAMAFMVVSK
jgi:hypothetical protein